MGLPLSHPAARGVGTWDVRHGDGSHRAGVIEPHMRIRPVLRSFLGAPLWLKLIGANALIMVMAAVVVTRTAYRDNEFHVLSGFFLVALLASTVVTVALVIIALRPLRALEHAAAEVWRGNTSARVPESPLADRDMARAGHTFNLLVDAMMQESVRSRELAALVISQAQSDQARIAYELHESAAQRLAAQVMQISAIARDSGDVHTRDAARSIFERRPQKRSSNCANWCIR